MKRVLPLSGSALALLVGAPGLAQDSSAEDGLQEIIVTASRRAESAQDVPLSISVVGGEQLASSGVSQAVDLANVVPGLAVTQNGAATVTVMRGVGTFVNDANAEAAIAYNVNGVYIARPAGIGPIFYDLERVEVLKGPQGTLYGRNASGGAINLVTARPGTHFEGYSSLEVGNDDLARLTAAVTLPVGERSALRAAGQFTRRDGYLTDGYDDQESEAARLTARWEPTEDLSILLTGEYTHVGGSGPGAVKRSVLRPVPENPWTGPSEPESSPPSASIPGGTTLQPGGPADIEVRAVSAELNYDLGAATLTFIPAYRDTVPAYTTYAPGFIFSTRETSKQKSYELRLGSDATALKWVAGLYYFDEDQTQLYLAQALPFQSSVVDTTLGTESSAVFAEANYSLTDTFRIIGGARYSEEKKRQDGLTTATLPRPGAVDAFGRRTFEEVNWKVGAEYDLGAENLVFLTAATGFKAGGFFPSVRSPANEFEPETLTAFTLGSRNRFHDGALQVNLEAFYWKYRDKQERFLGVTQTGTTAILTTNAGQATLNGAAIDVQYRPSRRDTLSLTAEYLDTKYDEFSFVTYNPPPFGTTLGYSPSATGCQLGPIIPLTANDPFVSTDSLQRIDCSGKPLVRAPRLSGSASYEHEFLVGAGAITPRVSAQFASSQYVSTDFIDSGRDDGYVMFDASLTYRGPQDRFSVQGWIRNIGDEAIYTGGFRYPYSMPAAAGGDPSLFYAGIRAPRTFGLTLRVEF